MSDVTPLPKAPVMPALDAVLPRRRRMSRTLLLAARREPVMETITIGELLAQLGDRSFAWCLLLVAIVNMLPLPLGATMLTALPILLIAVQMAIGYRHIRLPAFVTRKPVKIRSIRRMVIRLKPVFRPLEKLSKPRLLFLFSPTHERFVGLALIIVAVALFIPLPLSGWGPGIAVLVIAFGLVERDGLIVAIGLGIGTLAVTLTSVVAMALTLGALQLI